MNIFDFVIPAKAGIHAFLFSEDGSPIRSGMTQADDPADEGVCQAQNCKSTLKGGPPEKEDDTGIKKPDDRKYYHPVKSFVNKFMKLLHHLWYW
jgi:hypothetical protein